jgi:hypothetical protein
MEACRHFSKQSDGMVHNASLLEAIAADRLWP